jgi:hypothetical protein
VKSEASTPLEASAHLGKGKDMKTLTLVGCVWALVSFAQADALTIDEIIKLKKAGVSDSIIEMLIERDGSPRAAGTWRTNDGWIIHTTEVREPRPYANYDSRNSYPIFVEPNIAPGRRW